jgi:hypothetical protein
LEGLSLKILDEDKVFIREHPKRTTKGKKFWIATYKVYEDYKDKVPEEYLPYFLFHVGETVMRFGELRLGWELCTHAVLSKPSLLANPRRLWSLLKRGFRFWRG